MVHTLMEMLSSIYDVTLETQIVSTEIHEINMSEPSGFVCLESWNFWD